MDTDETNVEQGGIGPQNEKGDDEFVIPILKNSGSEIPESVIREMEILYARGASVEALASHFGVQESRVRRLESVYWLNIRSAVPEVPIWHDPAGLPEDVDGVPALLDLPAMAVEAAEQAAGMPLAPHAKATIALDWAQVQESHRQMVFRKASEALAAAALPAPSTWKDANIADQMARRAAGLDDRRDGPSIVIPINSAFSHNVERAV